MFANLAKGVGCVVIGGILSIIAFHWTDKSNHDEVMEKLKEFHDLIDPTITDVEEVRKLLRAEATKLLIEVRPRFVLVMTYHELEEAIDTYIALAVA